MTSRLRAASAVLGLIAFSAVFGLSSNSVRLTLRKAGRLRDVSIGTAVYSRLLGDPAYAAILGSEFSQLEPENEMKFAIVHPLPDAYDFIGGDALVSFARAHDMRVRGHTLVWHNQVPLWVSTANYNSFQLADILHQHILVVMKHYAGKVYAWDVVNEAFNDDGAMRATIWYDEPGIGFAHLGTRYIEQAFRWAHDADPQAKLFYNDYDAEVINEKSDAIYAMARDFKDRGVPLDGIGFQCHLTVAFDSHKALNSFAANMQRFANLGLEVQITELDIRLPDSSPGSLLRQARLYKEIAALCVQQPACKAIQTWGFTDAHSWIPGFFHGTGWGLLWDSSYQLKPAYFGVLDALQ
jgi:endo-1,4-beta-xylanase